MVKAVNKLVLEINNTENEYFEKAIFYIRPEMSCNSKLRSQAQLYLNKISLEKPGKFRSNGKLPYIIGIVPYNFFPYHQQTLEVREAKSNMYETMNLQIA